MSGSIIEIWPPYLAGFAIGLFVILHFWIMGRPAGCSTGYGNFCRLIYKRLPYFHTGEYRTPFNAKLWFLLGIPIGGFLSAITSPGDWQLTFDFGIYQNVFPQTIAATALWLIFGGFLLGFGARLAGACTTGHALVGGAMLNPPSLLAGFTFFISAFIVTQLLFNT